MWTSSSSSAAAAAAMSLSSSTSTSTSSAPPKLKTMEEVWKDINFAATDLRHHPSFRGVILQDFFSKDPPPTSAASPASTPLPPTILTLSSGLDHFGPLLFHPISNVSSPADAVVPDGGSGCVKKRFPDPEWSSGDLRHKRMIKNRESAARSRARKQEKHLL